MAFICTDVDPLFVLFPPVNQKKTKVSRQGSKLSKYVKKKRSQNPADTWGHQGSMESSSGFSGEEVDAGASDDKRLVTVGAGGVADK